MSRARRGRPDRGRLRPAARPRRRRGVAQGRDGTHDDAGSNVVWSGVFDRGDVDQALAGRRPCGQDREAPLPPLRRRSNARALSSNTTAAPARDFHCNHQMPGVGAIWMAPALRTGIDKLRFVTQDIGGGFGNKICLHPQYVVLCLMARKLGRPVQLTEWRTDQHTANAHGNERTFLDEVGAMADGTMTGFKVRAPMTAPSRATSRSAASSGPRSLLGCTAGGNIRVDFTQVCTNKSPVSPNRGYSRTCSTCGSRSGSSTSSPPSSSSTPSRSEEELREDRQALRDAERLRLRLGDYAAALDIALDLIDHGSIEERRKDAASRGKPRVRDRLDARPDEQLRAVDRTLISTRKQRGSLGQARHLRRGRRDARYRAAGAEGHETTSAQVVADILGCSPEQNVRRGHDTWFNPHAGFSGTYEPVRVHRAWRRQGRRGAPPRRDGAAGGRCCRRRRMRSSSPTGSRGSRTGWRKRRPVHGARRDRQREQRLPAARFQPDPGPPGTSAGRTSAWWTRRKRDSSRSRTRRRSTLRSSRSIRRRVLSTSPTTQPSTTAAFGST